MKANDTAKLLKLLAEHGEEKIGSAIASLRGLTKTAAPKIEESMGQLLPAIYEKAPALEGELVGDLATQAGKRALPDVEGQLASSIAPKMITQAEQAAPEVANVGFSFNRPNPDSLGETADFLKGSIDDSLNLNKTNFITPKKALIGAGLGIGGYAALNSNGPQPASVQPKAVQELPQADAEEDSSDDGMDTYEHPLTAKEKGAPIDASALLGLTKSPQDTEIPLQPTQQTPQADSFDQQLAAAHQQDNEHNLLFGMLKAGQMGGAALAGSKADTSFADTELAKNKEMATQLKTNMDVKEEAANIEEKKQKRDPNSKTSKLYQQMLNELNPDIDTEGLSADQVEKIFPQIGTIMAHRETAENMRLKNEGLLQSKTAASDKKLEDTIAKEKTELDKHLTGQTKGRSGAVQGALAQKMRGESINQMFENLPRKADGNINFGAAGVAHKEELIKGIDLMLSGGRSTIGGTEHLRQAYATGIDKLTAIRQKIALGKLPELGEEKIIEQMYDLMNRESDVARLQAGKGLGSSISTGFQHTTPEDKRLAIAKISDVSPAEQELMMDNNATVTQMMELKRRGIAPDDALALLRTGKKLPEILKAPGKSTTVSNKETVGLKNPQKPGSTLIHNDGKKYRVGPNGLTATEI